MAVSIQPYSLNPKGVLPRKTPKTHFQTKTKVPLYSAYNIKNICLLVFRKRMLFPVRSFQIATSKYGKVRFGRKNWL